MDNPWRGRGIAVRHRRKSELALVVLMIAVFIGVLAWRVPPLMIAAERASVNTTIGQLRSALGTRVAERIAAGRRRSLAELAGANPADLVEGVPQHYAGTVDAHDGELDPGSWYFDADTGTLRYKVLHSGAFWAAGGPGDEVWLRIELSFEDADGDGRYDASSDELYRVSLNRSYDYCWCDPDEGSEEHGDDVARGAGLAR